LNSRLEPEFDEIYKGSSCERHGHSRHPDCNRRNVFLANRSCVFRQIARRRRIANRRVFTEIRDTSFSCLSGCNLCWPGNSGIGARIAHGASATIRSRRWNARNCVLSGGLSCSCRGRWSCLLIESPRRRTLRSHSWNWWRDRAGSFRKRYCGRASAGWSCSLRLVASQKSTEQVDGETSATGRTADRRHRHRTSFKWQLATDSGTVADERCRRAVLLDSGVDAAVGSRGRHRIEGRHERFITSVTSPRLRRLGSTRHRWFWQDGQECVDFRKIVARRHVVLVRRRSACGNHWPWVFTY
jgi:hypothetical protein